MDRTHDSSGGIKIREMQHGDLDQIMAIEQVSFPTPWSRRMFLSELRGTLSRNFTAGLEKETGFELLGYINYWIYADEAHLNNLAVRTDYRGKGVAFSLVVDMIKRARMEGARWSTLEVRQSNKAALRLYKKLGYDVRGVRPHYYDDTHEDALIMWLDLEDVGGR